MIFPLFLIPILSGLAAQALKPLLNKRRTAPAHIPRYGGMPSAHTSFAVSLVTIIGLNNGVLTAPFALATAFMIYTLDDALRMRIFLGHYGQALQKLIKGLSDEDLKSIPYIEPRLGHTLPEVIAGAILGFIVSVIVFEIIRVY